MEYHQRVRSRANFNRVGLTGGAFRGAHFYGSGGGGGGRVGSGCGLLAYWAGPPPRVGEGISKYGKVLNPGAWCR